MNINKKRWLLLLIIAVILVIVTIVVYAINRNDNKEVEEKNEETVNVEKYTTELENGKKLNTSEEFNTTKKYRDLEISNMQYTEQNDISVMLADVTNTGNRIHEPEIVKITIYGDNNEVITEIKPVIGTIEPGETIKLNASILADVANAKDYTIEAIE